MRFARLFLKNLNFYLSSSSSLKASLVRLEGFEPPTFWFVAKHSIQLSYSRISLISCRQLSYISISISKMQALFLNFLKFFSLSEISIGVYNWPFYECPQKNEKEQGVFQPCSCRSVFSSPNWNLLNCNACCNKQVCLFFYCTFNKYFITDFGIGFTILRQPKLNVFIVGGN